MSSTLDKVTALFWDKAKTIMYYPHSFHNIARFSLLFLPRFYFWYCPIGYWKVSFDLMFYSKQLRLPRNRNPLRGMWGRRSSQETAGNLTVVQRQEGIWLHPWGLELRKGQRQRHLPQHSTPWPYSCSTIHSASCSAQLLYCICMNILCGSYRGQGDNQGLAALPLSSLLHRLWR